MGSVKGYIWDAILIGALWTGSIRVGGYFAIGTAAFVTGMMVMLAFMDAVDYYMRRKYYHG